MKLRRDTARKIMQEESMEDLIEMREILVASFYRQFRKATENSSDTTASYTFPDGHVILVSEEEKETEPFYRFRLLASPSEVKGGRFEKEQNILASICSCGVDDEEEFRNMVLMLLEIHKFHVAAEYFRGKISDRTV